MEWMKRARVEREGRVSKGKGRGRGKRTGRVAEAVEEGAVRRQARVGKCRRDKEIDERRGENR